MALPGQTPGIIPGQITDARLRPMPNVFRGAQNQVMRPQIVEQQPVQPVPQGMSRVLGGTFPGDTPPIMTDGRNQGLQDPRMIQTQQSLQPQFGLAGSEQALQAGLGAGISALEQGQQGALSSLGAGRDLLLGGANAGVSQIQQALGGALGQLGQGQQALSDNFGASAVTVDPNTGQPLFQQAAQGVGAFSPAGLQAQGLQSALSGAQGQEAFNQALLNSPIQKFLQEQGQQAVINQAAATGGLGGGAVQQELQRVGQGIAGQQLQQQIQNLQALSGQGLQAAGQQGQFLSQAGQQQGNLAGMNAQLGTQVNLANARNALQAAGQRAQLFGQGAQALQNAGLQGANLLGQATGQAANLFGQGANIQSGLGQQAAGLFAGTGQNIAQGRTQAGRDLASQIGGTTSQLSQLANQQGSGLADLIGQGGSNLANLLSGAGQLTGANQQQLAQLLANLAVGEGSQIAGAQQGIGEAKAGGILGRAEALGGSAGDVAALMAQFFSDERLKTNIKKIGSRNGINFYRWDWNGKLGLTGSDSGVLAQEIEKVIPNAVTNTGTGFKAVRYDIVEEYINA